MSSLSGVQVDEDLQGSEVGSTLHRSALAGGHSAGESFHTHRSNRTSDASGPAPQSGSDRSDSMSEQGVCVGGLLSSSSGSLWPDLGGKFESPAQTHCAVTSSASTAAFRISSEPNGPDMKTGAQLETAQSCDGSCDM